MLTITSPNKASKQHGAVVVVALFIVALVAGIAVFMALRQQINIRVTELMINNDRGYFYLQGVPDWAIGQLLRAGQQKPGSQVADIFPELKPIQFADAVISGSIQDQQGLYNINSLSNANNINSFVRLLLAVAPELHGSAKQATSIALAINQWLSTSNADEYYSKLNPPYQAAHHPMTSISELRLVAGVTDKLYQEIAPYISALPMAKNVVNINTAPVPVLMSLGNISANQAQGIISCRQSTKGFVTMDNFNTCLTQLQATLDSNQQVTLISNYFLSIGHILIGKHQLTLYSLLYRQIQNNQVSVMVLWQSRDTL